MKKILALFAAVGIAALTQTAHAQSARNIAPNNIGPAPQPCFGIGCNQPPPPPGPVYGQTCPPGYVTQITQDQWGRTVAVNCVNSGNRPPNLIGNIVEDFIGGIINRR